MHACMYICVYVRTYLSVSLLCSLSLVSLSLYPSCFPGSALLCRKWPVPRMNASLHSPRDRTPRLTPKLPQAISMAVKDRPVRSTKGMVICSYNWADEPNVSKQRSLCDAWILNRDRYVRHHSISKRCPMSILNMALLF